MTPPPGTDNKLARSNHITGKIPLSNSVLIFDVELPGIQ